MSEAPNRVLLDSSAVISHFRGKFNMYAKGVPAESLFLSAIVLGELLKGAMKAGNPIRQMQLIADLVAVTQVLEVGSSTATCYAELSVFLERIGKPIPENDRWIAATAQEHGMSVATCDAHFDRIPDLAVLRW